MHPTWQMPCMVAAGGAAGMTLLAGVVMWTRWQKEQAKAQREQELLSLIAENTGKDLTRVRRVIVLPGGGPGAPEDCGMPAWTRQRTEAAAEAYANCSGSTNGHVLIYCTSAASMNAPQPTDEAGNILFESTLMGQLLEQRGVPARDIVCDFLPWDTVGNAWSVRLAVAAILALSGSRHKSAMQPLVVDVFISDFHAKRMEAALEWVLDLEPSPLLRSGKVVLSVCSVSSGNALVQNMSGKIAKDGAQQVALRIAHEEKGVEQIRRNQSAICTEAELSAFLLLGGHMGYRKYTTRGIGGSSLHASKGAGW